jgi:transposase-like protein
MSEQRRKFSPQFKAEAVPMVIEAGRPIADVARDLGVVAQTLGNWVDQYANNLVEADHGRLKARLRPMCGVKTTSSLRLVAAGHALVQNLRRGHYELTAEQHVGDRVRGAFDELACCL